MNRTRSCSCELFKKISINNNNELINKGSNESLMSMVSLSSLDSITSMTEIDNKEKINKDKGNKEKVNKKNRMKREREMTIKRNISTPIIEKWIDFMNDYEISVITNGWGFYADLKDTN